MGGSGDRQLGVRSTGVALPPSEEVVVSPSAADVTQGPFIEIEKRVQSDSNPEGADRGALEVFAQVSVWPCRFSCFDAVVIQQVDLYLF